MCQRCCDEDDVHDGEDALSLSDVLARFMPPLVLSIESDEVFQ